MTTQRVGSARLMFVPETPRKLPDFVTWPSFPFEGDLRVRPLEPVVDVEPSRDGEDIANCTACAAPDQAYIWVSERWRVRAMDRPTGLPMVLILESRSHLDLGDLPNLLAAELGVMTVRLERAIRSLDGVARVHVNRWGDGSAHLHLWFLARPTGRLQLRGSFLSLWNDILPAVPEAQWRENLALVAAWLAEFGGRPLAEPPRIQWQAPATFAAVDPAAQAAKAVGQGPGAVGPVEVTGTAEGHGTAEEGSAGEGRGEAGVTSAAGPPSATKMPPAIGRATVESPVVPARSASSGPGPDTAPTATPAANGSPSPTATAAPDAATGGAAATNSTVPNSAATNGTTTGGTPAENGGPAVREVPSSEVATERLDRPAVPGPRTSPESSGGSPATAEAAGAGGARAAAS